MATATKVDISPLEDRVLVTVDDEEQTTASGIVIPDTAKEKPQQGEIMAVGPGKLSDEGARLEPEVEVGNRVLYGKYSGTEVTVDGEEFLILRESDVLAVIS